MFYSGAIYLLFNTLNKLPLNILGGGLKHLTKHFSNVRTYHLKDI